MRGDQSDVLAFVLRAELRTRSESPPQNSCQHPASSAAAGPSSATSPALNSHRRFFNNANAGVSRTASNFSEFIFYRYYFTALRSDRLLATRQNIDGKSPDHG